MWSWKIFLCNLWRAKFSTLVVQDCRIDQGFQKYKSLFQVLVFQQFTGKSVDSHGWTLKQYYTQFKEIYLMSCFSLLFFFNNWKILKHWTTYFYLHSWGKTPKFKSAQAEWSDLGDLKGQFSSQWNFDECPGSQWAGRIHCWW